MQTVGFIYSKYEISSYIIYIITCITYMETEELARSIHRKHVTHEANIYEKSVNIRSTPL